MVVVRLRRTFAVLAAFVVAACLAPSPADAAVKRHRAKRAVHACQAVCFSQWHNSLSSRHTTNENPSDDVVDFFDDRDTRTDPTPTAIADDEATSSSDNTITLPWVRARRTAAPHVARLVVWRKLAAPRPPPSI
jgi:membrane-bound lytic murein transglycosylase B